MLLSHSHPKRIRIPTPIRLRPPSTTNIHPHPRPRPFTNSTTTSSILPPTRPQLPFLYTPPSKIKITLRPLSTDRRKKFTDGLKIAVKAYFAILLLFVIQKGVYQEEIEREYPTPEEWSLRSRWCLRSARAMQDGKGQRKEERIRAGLTNWSEVGDYYVDLIARLEGGECDGEGLGRVAVENGDGGEGGAYDIEGMSEAWKKGYFEALMGAGETAEKLDGWVRDSGSKVAAPREYVAGPTNANPIVPPVYMGRVPRAEYSVTAFEGPEGFYEKVMNTKGFQTNQKLDAALAYADWLDYKGLKRRAGEVYGRAMEIATAGLSVDARKVVDCKTGVLKDVGRGGGGEGEGGGKYVTENLLRASTALGVHQVRTGDLSSALSTFLSVLRARRSISAAQPQPSSPDAKSQYPLELKPRLPSVLDRIASFFTPPPYPLPTTTGNERPTPSPCSEAGLMLYIGEIISASSSLEHGLSWTRDAVDIAQLALLEHDPAAERAQPTSYGMRYASTEQKCGECLKAGMDNWAAMVRRLVVRAEQEELESMEKVDEGWFGMGARRAREKRMARRRWEAEEMILADRRKRLERIVGDGGPMLVM